MKSIKIPYGFSGGKTNVTSSLITIAEQKIVDLLITSKYQRLIRHRYGAGINRLLFEPIDELSISDFLIDARQDAKEYISRVDILDLKIMPQGKLSMYTNDETTVGVNVTYKLPLGSPRVVKFNVAVPGALTEDTPI
jgi:phage baseplate assembly protein W